MAAADYRCCTRPRGGRPGGCGLRTDIVEWAQGADPEFCEALGFDRAQPPERVHGWLVETSIESDHERFSGFLKVSLEEVIVALHDDRGLLKDPDGLLSRPPPTETAFADRQARTSRYPARFSADRFVSVVEGELVWDAL